MTATFHQNVEQELCHQPLALALDVRQKYNIIKIRHMLCSGSSLHILLVDYRLSKTCHAGAIL
jgi:hypothetical protein